MSLPMRYGRPKTAARKKKNGFLEGRGGAGEPSGRVAGPEPLPENAAKAEGVRAAASAGGGRPVSFANSVLSHLIMANIPSTEPRVSRRLPNCSATDTIAKENKVSPEQQTNRECKQNATYQKMTSASPCRCSLTSERIRQKHQQYSRSTETWPGCSG